MAIWIAAEPTPLDAASTSTSSPGCMRARVISMCQAVRNTRGAAAASFVRQVVGNLQNAILRRRYQFRVAAVPPQAEERVAAAAIVVAREARLALAAAQSRRKDHAPAGLYALAEFAHFHHIARNVAAQHVRHGEWHAGNSGAHKEIEMIQRAGADAHQHLVGFDFRVGNVFV